MNTTNSSTNLLINNQYYNDLKEVIGQKNVLTAVSMLQPLTLQQIVENKIIPDEQEQQNQIPKEILGVILEKQSNQDFDHYNEEGGILHHLVKDGFGPDLFKRILERLNPKQLEIKNSKDQTAFSYASYMKAPSEIIEIFKTHIRRNTPSLPENIQSLLDIAEELSRVKNPFELSVLEKSLPNKNWGEKESDDSFSDNYRKIKNIPKLFSSTLTKQEKKSKKINIEEKHKEIEKSRARRQKIERLSDIVIKAQLELLEITRCDGKFGLPPSPFAMSQTVCDFVQGELDLVRPYVQQHLDEPQNSCFAGRCLVNFAFQKKLEQGSKREQLIHAQFDGISWTLLTQQVFHIKNYINKNPVGVNIDHVKLVRRNIKSLVFNNLLYCKIETSECAQKYCQKVEALTDIASKDVIHLDNLSMFSIPGGCINHAVTYEIQYKEGNYYFVLNNRGLGADDQELHGTITFEHNERAYYKTSVKILIDKTSLTKEFFSELIISNNSYDMKLAYSCIKKHLLRNNAKNRIYLDKEELQLKKAFMMTTPEIKKLQQVLLKSGKYHTLQAFGTCQYSNTKTTVERSIDPKTRKLMNIYITQQLINQVEATWYLDKSTQQTLLELGNKRLVHLNNKLKQLEENK